MQVETIKMSEGILTLTRDGRKLVKVSYDTGKKINLATSMFGDIDSCVYCGCFLEENERGVMVDFMDRFLCRQSPSAMHKVAA